MYTGGSQSRNRYGWTTNQITPDVYRGTVVLDYGTDTIRCDELRPLACCE